MLKKRWSREEDQRLKEGVTQCSQDKYNRMHWHTISEQFVKTRSWEQCSHRWKTALDPKLSKEPWSNDEIKKLQNIVIEQYKSAKPDLDVQAVIHGHTSWPLEILPNFHEVVVAFEGKRAIRACYREWYSRADPSFKFGKFSAQEVEHLKELKKDPNLSYTKISKLMHRSKFTCSTVWNRCRVSENFSAAAIKTVEQEERSGAESDDISQFALEEQHEDEQEQEQHGSMLGKRTRDDWQDGVETSEIPELNLL